MISSWRRKSAWRDMVRWSVCPGPEIPQAACTIRAAAFLGPFPGGFLPFFVLSVLYSWSHVRLRGNSATSCEEIFSKIWNSFTFCFMCFSSPLLFLVLVQQKMEVLEITFVHWFKQSLTSKTRPGEAFSRSLLLLFFCWVFLVLDHSFFCQPLFPPLLKEETQSVLATERNPTVSLQMTSASVIKDFLDVAQFRVCLSFTKLWVPSPAPHQSKGASDCL